MLSGGGDFVFGRGMNTYESLTGAGIHWPMSNRTDLRGKGVACINRHQQVDGTSMERSAKAGAHQISCNLSNFSAVCVTQNVNN
jgi:hypothetical protein